MCNEFKNTYYKDVDKINNRIYERNYNMKNNFKSSLSKGKKAEAIIYQLLTQNGEAVITDVSDDIEYQKIDVDFTSSIHGNLEVKSDEKIMQYQNLTFEMCNKRISGDKEGWFHYCEADLLIFVDTIAHCIFILNFKQNKETIRRLSKIKEYDNKVDNCRSILLLLDIETAVRNNIIEYIYVYDNDLETAVLYDKYEK